MENVPQECLDALRTGFQFSFWRLLRSTIGKFKLKTADQLALTTITTFPGCQSIHNDPFQPFDGMYHIDVVDLIAECSKYDTEGLFCWIPLLTCFAAVDPEHGDILTFPSATWADIVRSPIRYLEAQWGESGDGIRVFPWLHFPFRLNSSDVALSPYPMHCSLHDSPVVEHHRKRHFMFNAYRNRDVTAWLDESRASFPWSGVPATETTLKSCSKCFDAEAEWLQKIDDSIPILEARKNKGGFIQCPNCSIRFSPMDQFSFVNGTHIRCGQKINILEVVAT